LCRQPGEDEGRERRANLGGRKPLRNLNSAASRTPALRRHDERTQWAGSPNDEEIVAFSIADRNKSTIFALFVLAAYEGRGIGSRLFDLAVGWLWESSARFAWLNTGPNTGASAFYERRGWVAMGTVPSGETADGRQSCPAG